MRAAQVRQSIDQSERERVASSQQEKPKYVVFGRMVGKPSREALASADAAAQQVKNAPQVQLPFVLDLQRPDKSRVEIEFGHAARYSGKIILSPVAPVVLSPPG